MAIQYVGSVSKMTRKARAKNWLSVGRVGEYCLVSTATVRRWIKHGDLSAMRLPSGHYRIRLADFKDFLKRHDMPVRRELELYDVETIRAYKETGRAQSKGRANG